MRDELLIWYEQNKRQLPWRVKNPDPYHVLLSEFMLQQTTTTAVKPYYQKFLAQWPTLESLARAPDEEVMRAWAGLGYYSRARNLLKTVRDIDLRGEFPNRAAELILLSGVGEYTSAAIASIAFQEAILPIDGNVKRVLARFSALDDPVDKPNPALKVTAAKWEDVDRPGDVAQAFMDLGALICRPKNPKCEMCPLSQKCQVFQRGTMEDYPKRSPKKPKKNWNGHSVIIETPLGIVFEKRAQGLLKGMDGLPTLMGENVRFEPPFEGEWVNLGEISHVFTHIYLRLTLWHINLETTPQSNAWFILDSDQQKNTASLWRKALKKYRQCYER